MSKQLLPTSDKLTELLSRASPRDIEIISKNLTNGVGSKQLFAELCRSNLGFWTMFMNEVSKNDNVSFESAMFGAQLAIGIMARRSKIDYLKASLDIKHPLSKNQERVSKNSGAFSKISTIST